VRVGTPGAGVLVGSAESGRTVLPEAGAGIGRVLDGAAVIVTVITEIGGAVIAAAATWKYLEGYPQE
jgi:hypothetical protein